MSVLSAIITLFNMTLGISHLFYLSLTSKNVNLKILFFLKVEWLFIVLNVENFELKPNVFTSIFCNFMHCRCNSLSGLGITHLLIHSSSINASAWRNHAYTLYIKVLKLPAWNLEVAQVAQLSGLPANQTDAS